MTAPGATEIVDIKKSPSLVTGLSVPALAGTLHPAVDRVRLDIDDRLVGVAFVRECADGAGELLRDRRFPILPALRVVVPHAEEAVRSVREVVAGDTGDLFTPEAGLHAEAEGDLLLRRSRLVNERCDLVVLIGLVEPDSFPVSFVVVGEAHSRLNWLILHKTM